ncbi:MAG: type II toxin-antitoxin system RelE/ParE family toxin [Candidatus Rokubacteria bacterium]|nr:type II toxin-antitoxin system RelE/ParE family toxin [Candidatus Rokubacteria bacterium]
MQVEFRTRKLRDCYQDSKKAAQEWGEKVARHYIERVNILKAAKSADDLYKIVVLRFHPLKGDKKGRFALTLTDRWRLILTFLDEAKKIVRIEEVSKHYGD